MTEDIDMPGRPVQPWYGADNGTFGQIWTAAHGIFYNCVYGKGLAAWTSVGESDSVELVL